MSPFHEQVVPLPRPAPVASVQGTLALDLTRRPRRRVRPPPLGHRAHARRARAPGRGVAWAHRFAQAAVEIAGGDRPVKPAARAGRRRRSTRTSPAGRNWSGRPSPRDAHAGAGAAGTPPRRERPRLLARRRRRRGQRPGPPRTTLPRRGHPVREARRTAGSPSPWSSPRALLPVHALRA